MGEAPPPLSYSSRPRYASHHIIAVGRARYPNCNSRWAAAEGGRVWCEDPKKVPRKFAPKAVHGADIRAGGSEGAVKPGGAGESGGPTPGAEGEGADGDSRNAAKVRACGLDIVLQGGFSCQSLSVRGRFSLAFSHPCVPSSFMARPAC